MAHTCLWLSYTYMEGEVDNGLKKAEILRRSNLFFLQYHQNKIFEKVIGKQWFPIQINTTPTLP